MIRVAPWKNPPLRFYFALAAAVLALAGVALLATQLIGVECAQARSLVLSGQRELERGEPARAALQFERAHLVAPRAGFVRAALDGVRGADAGSRLVRGVSWVAPREWSLLLVGSAWLTGLGLALLIAQRSKLPLARRATILAALFCVVSSAGYVQSRRAAGCLAVVTNATGLLLSPYEGAGATANLSRAVVVQQGQRYADFVEVEGPDGTHGWVAGSALEPVLGH
jgi:hypothetical protein